MSKVFLIIDCGTTNLRVTLLDAQKLERMIFNMLSNAIKFTPPGGNIDAKLTRRDRKLYLSIRDSGSGVSEAVRSSLFSRYLREAGLEDSRERITAAATVMSRAVYAPMTAAQPQTLAIDYDKLGESVARANRAAGIGTAVLDVDGRRMSRQLEPGVMHAGQLRSRQSVSGRSSRMVTVR